MYLCICRGVNAEEADQAIEREECVSEFCRRSGACRDCGSCKKSVSKYFEKFATSCRCDRCEAFFTTP